MKLYGVIALHVHGDEVMRAPRFIDKLKRAFGGTPDLRSGRMRAALEATAVVDGVRDAMSPRSRRAPDIRARSPRCAWSSRRASPR